MKNPKKAKKPKKPKKPDDSFLDEVDPKRPISPEAFQEMRKIARVSLENATKRFPGVPSWEEGTAYPSMRELQAYSGALLVNSYGVACDIENGDPVLRDIFGGDGDRYEKRNREKPYLDLRTAGSGPVGHSLFDFLDTPRVYHDQTQQMCLEVFGSEPLDIASLPSQEELREIGKTQGIQELADTLGDHQIQVMAEIVIPMKHGDPEILAETVLNPEDFHGFTVYDALAPMIGLNLWAPDNVESLLYGVQLLRNPETAKRNTLYHIPESESSKQAQARQEQYRKFRDGDLEIYKNPEDPMFLQNGACGFVPIDDQKILPFPTLFLSWLKEATQGGKILYTNAFKHTNRWAKYDLLVAAGHKAYQERLDRKKSEKAETQA